PGFWTTNYPDAAMTGGRFRAENDAWRALASDHVEVSLLRCRAIPVGDFRRSPSTGLALEQARSPNQAVQHSRPPRVRAETGGAAPNVAAPFSIRARIAT